MAEYSFYDAMTDHFTNLLIDELPSVLGRDDVHWESVQLDGMSRPCIRYDVGSESIYVEFLVREVTTLGDESVYLEAESVHARRLVPGWHFVVVQRLLRYHESVPSARIVSDLRDAWWLTGSRLDLSVVSQYFEWATVSVLGVALFRDVPKLMLLPSGRVQQPIWLRYVHEAGRAGVLVKTSRKVSQPLYVWDGKVYTHVLERHLRHLVVRGAPVELGVDPFV